MSKITLRSDRETDYTFTYKGEEITLESGSSLDIVDGLENVVLPTCVMKIIGRVIVVKDDAAN